MKRKIIVPSVLAACVVCSASYGDWSVWSSGTWSDQWPKELAPLRKQSRTLQGGLADLKFHEIPFDKRADFEAAWPHLLKVKRKGDPITLLRSPHEFLGTVEAGVRVWDPTGKDRGIWLVVDGKIVDLNRIPFPPDTPIIDKRFEKTDKKTPAKASSRLP